MLDTPDAADGEAADLAALRAKLARDVAVLELAQYREAEQKLFAFLRAAWPILEPGRRLSRNWHLETICDALEAVADGRIRRLVVNVPPRSSKSTIVSVAFPCWMWLRDPTRRFLTGSHAAGLATRDAVRSRRLMESPWWRRGWGDRFAMAGDQNQKTRYENDRTGHRIAFGVTSGVTGEGGDVIILDDPNHADAMLSEAHRRQVNEAYDQGISTRLNDPDRSAVVLVMQRFAADDLAGHLLARGGWAHLRLPMMYEAAEPCVIPEIGFRDPRTREGELLWPARFPRAWVDEQAKTLGTFGVASQLQQRPAPLEGGMIDLKWFRRYRALPSRDRWVEVVISVDSAQKGVELVNAPWVIGTWIRTETGAYLVKVTRRWMNYPEGKRALLSEHEWCSRHLAPPHAVLVEDKATGSSLLQELGEQTSMPLLAVVPDRDKVQRLGVESPYIEAGNVWLPEQADWLSAYEQEMSAFPNASTADQADMTSQTLRHFREGGADAGPRLRAL